MYPFICHVHSKTRLSNSVNYKTGFYANLADVTGNFVCWGKILTHDHLSIEKKVQTCFVQMTESDKECTSLAGRHSAKNRKRSCHMMRSLTDSQTSWYWFVRWIRSSFRIEACESVILFWNYKRRFMVEKFGLSTIIYRVV